MGVIRECDWRGTVELIRNKVFNARGNDATAARTLKGRVPRSTNRIHNFPSLSFKLKLVSLWSNRSTHWTSEGWSTAGYGNATPDCQQPSACKPPLRRPDSFANTVFRFLFIGELFNMMWIWCGVRAAGLPVCMWHTC
ncbi:uncharacterized protein MELLADRAFT_111597 [Melampsora larici-populina 98AG31]|uniref:Uncharacterized protein n=1 Tax=Melampsora larici-populina (strain 98AG31 / pathotype 3-4-7) TaxID=747676 RepID=F4S3Q3_MELLP|nr:uncharacterized protein MELLADRAFT_111597 [Melampsora larici-populina 98AG31]EGG00712.1 hypothetical protein MELLADRAFT_111597 [Melampsora larici-populina 98AG31]